ncbi:MAG: DUF2442 domain-containing protein [Fimbriimonadaceae bacterium]|nr:DUF2442 domain-containing protein [Fimbriimonadaceae bacterium]
MLLGFTSGETRLFDAQTLPDRGVLRTWQDPAYFGTVRAKDGTICWPNGLDLCPDRLDASSRPRTVGEVEALLAPGRAWRVLEPRLAAPAAGTFRS